MHLIHPLTFHSPLNSSRPLPFDRSHNKPDSTLNSTESDWAHRPTNLGTSKNPLHPHFKSLHPSRSQTILRALQPSAFSNMRGISAFSFSFASAQREIELKQSWCTETLRIAHWRVDQDPSRQISWMRNVDVNTKFCDDEERFYLQWLMAFIYVHLFWSWMLSVIGTKMEGQYKSQWDSTATGLNVEKLPRFIDIQEDQTLQDLFINT